MKWLKKLNNPFFLGFQGFVAGAILFFATHPDAMDTVVKRDASPSAEQQARQGA